MKSQNSKVSKPDYYRPKSEEQTVLAFFMLITAAFSVYIILRIMLNPNTTFDIADAPIIFYFTVQTNIITVIWLTALSLFVFTGRKIFKFAVNIYLSAAIASYMLVNGIIFWFVLVPIFAPTSDVALFNPPNMWLHTATPLISIAVLKYVNIQKNDDALKPKVLQFIIYPAIYILVGVYLSVNGTYLYPMLNPALVGGWIGVGVCMAATLGFVAVIYIVVVNQLNNSIYID